VWSAMTSPIERMSPRLFRGRWTGAFFEFPARESAFRFVGTAGRERDRDEAADRPLEREAPDRPAGRLVAVVTVGNRLVPQRHRHGDALWAADQTVTMTGTIIGRCRVRSPTSRPMALRATRLRVSWSWLPDASACTRAFVTWTRASSKMASVSWS
jgi:hypothetical protein